MDPKRWQKIDKLVDEALARPAAERAEFVAARGEGDPELVRAVLELVAANESAEDFLENSAMNIVARSLADEVTEANDVGLAGERVGNYKIERVLGKGGMGEVYLAYDEKLRRNVALKVLPAEYGSNDERVRRFELEAHAVSRLNHPNIVTIFDVGSFNGVNYIATEFVEGETIRQMMGRAPSVSDILGVMIQVCDALAAAHNEGIIHRDIKPENIMIRSDGYAKVLDFGLAKLVEPSGDVEAILTKTTKGVLLGTPAYMSPEQVSDDVVDHRTDLWSMGVILYEALTRKHPFKGANRQETFRAILSANAVPASTLRPDIPEELDRILAKALEKSPDEGYQTAGDLRADLKRVERGVDSSPSISSETALAVGIRRRRRSRFGAAAAFAILAAAGAGIFYALYTKAEPPVDWSRATHLQVTTSPWIEGYPSLSPDGKNIVYASDPDGDRNIYLQRVNGKTPVNLTPDSSASDTMPAFSPNGELIAFRSERSPAGIYIMEQTGENPRRISELGFHPAWSADGTKVIVSDRAAAVHSVHTVPNSSLWEIDVTTGAANRLETGGDAIMPSVSPNGHRIAFWLASPDRSAEIATVPAGGGKPVPVAVNASAEWNPVWSPDGKYLYFASNRGGNMSFWRIAIDERTGETAAEPESVPTPSKYCRHISLSRDGNVLAYVRYESRSNLQGFAFDTATLERKGSVEWITRGNNEVGNPDLSPDGSTFVIRNPGLTQEDLVIMDRDGANWRFLTNDGFTERSPQWSPDGRRIAFHSNRGDRDQIWSVTADGTDPAQITFTEKTGANTPIFSPDGTRMVFTEIDGSVKTSSIIDLTKPWAEQTPEPMPPMPGGGSYSVRDWSPDGDRLLVITFEPDGDESGVGIYDLRRGEYRTISKTGTSPVWLNDSRHFIFIDKNAVSLYDSETGNVRELFRSPVYEIQQVNITADNRQIFFRYLQIDADVWLIDASGPAEAE